MIASYQLPLPPSVNRIWRHGKGRVHRSSSYHTWARTAGWHLHEQGLTYISGEYRLTIYVPSAMRGDIDNRAKAICDLLARCGITDDDRFMTELRIIRVREVPAGACIVSIESATGHASGRGAARREASPGLLPSPP